MASPRGRYAPLPPFADNLHHAGIQVQLIQRQADQLRYPQSVCASVSSIALSLQAQCVVAIGACSSPSTSISDRLKGAGESVSGAPISKGGSVCSVPCNS